MQNLAGVTQFNGMKPRTQINMGGIDWSLRRDATDASMVFPHDKVNWLNAGCEPMADGRVHYCWIMGIIAPTPGTIERPVNVMYVGFHPNKITIAPNAISIGDLDRMHVYTSDGSDFAGSFVRKFLGSEPEPVAAREQISPWPPMLDQEVLNPRPETKVAPAPAAPQAPTPASGSRKPEEKGNVDDE
ncbi:hypothetical protein [Hafnia phage yong3]|nr:hypothetical protein [Hafnia phage yong3]